MPVHGICGIWGTISLGLFACGRYGATGPISPDNSAPLKGLFYGGGTQVLVAQIIGSAAITAGTFGVAMVVMLAVNATGTLRLSPEAELYGTACRQRRNSTAWTCTSTESRRIRSTRFHRLHRHRVCPIQTEAAAKANALESKAMARTALGRATS